jgi:hypothetical protein
MTTKLTYKDQNLTQCLINSNNLSARVSRVDSVLNDLSEFNIMLMDDKKQAKRLLKLKKLIAQSLELANEIDSTFHNGIYNRS